MKKIISITLFCVLFLTFVNGASAGYYEIGVPAVCDSIRITVKDADGDLWKPGDQIDDLWITVEPYGGSVIELFYDEGDCVFIVYFDPDQIYFEPTGAYVNGIESKVWHFDPNIYKIRVNDKEEISNFTENQEESLLIRILNIFREFFSNFFNFFK